MLPQLSLNPLDLSSEKSKANVGRSVGRRPPSRPRAREESISNPLRTAQQNLYRGSRLCHQIHDNTVKETFGKYYKPKNDTPRENGIEITEIKSISSSDSEKTNNHTLLTTNKSTSSEDLHLIEDKSKKSTEDLEDLEQLQSWRRTSKLRRSLQYPTHTDPPVGNKPDDLPENSGSVRKIREELEKGRRLSTALRGNNVDLEALDQILQSISSSSSNYSDKSEETCDVDKETKQKRNSFITVETLQEVKNRLRRTSSPTENSSKYQHKRDEETDDGIATEETTNIKMPACDKTPQTRVRSYVFGMETMMNKKPIVGTGSLESRSKVLNGNANVRNEDWYNRRKSYGFEQVHQQNENPCAVSLGSKSRVESSTDSGICRSSEIVLVPTPTKNHEHFISCENGIKNYNSVKHISSIFDSPNFGKKSTTITIPIASKPNSNFIDLTLDDIPEKEIKRHSIAVDESKYVTNHNENKFRRTSLAVNPSSNDLSDDVASQNRKSKKVEFCKTEVHFAADSGKVNIVETDEKPPPTNNFRRRRRNSGPVLDLHPETNGLPVIHFGDTSYEKSLLGVADEDKFKQSEDNIYQNVPTTPAYNTVTVNTNSSPYGIPSEDDKKDLSENVRGILKNKPTPYHLGEDYSLSYPNNGSSDSDNGKWGVKLKPVQKNDPPFWKSTVTLQNTIYSDGLRDDKQPEFQRLLRNLKSTNGNNKPDLLDNGPRSLDNLSSVKFVTSTDSRKLWSVADRVKLTEDAQWAENKPYSTKVNFGDGGTAVVECDRYVDKPPGSSWPKRETPIKGKAVFFSCRFVSLLSNVLYCIF